MALFASVPLAVAVILTGVAYVHYAKLIDAQIAAGPFHDSIDIYGAPTVFNDGDALSEKDIEAELKLSGICAGSKQKNRQFPRIPGRHRNQSRSGLR